MKPSPKIVINFPRTYEKLHCKKTTSVQQRHTDTSTDILLLLYKDYKLKVSFDFEMNKK